MRPPSIGTIVLRNEISKFRKSKNILVFHKHMSHTNKPMASYLFACFQLLCVATGRCPPHRLANVRDASQLVAHGTMAARRVGVWRIHSCVKRSRRLGGRVSPTKKWHLRTQPLGNDFSGSMEAGKRGSLFFFFAFSISKNWDF